MTTLQAQHIHLAFGERELLNDVSLTLCGSVRAALTGSNGSGKTTLLKILSGILSPDSGSVTRSKGILVSYLPQSDLVYGTHTVYEEVEKSFDRFHLLVAQQHQLEEQLAQHTDPSSTEKLLHALHEIQEKIFASAYYQREAIIGQILKGLGFSPRDAQKKCEQFSGGWQMRIALAKVLAENPDVLLLDEPTNYLDLDARVWLCNFLAQFAGSVLIVAHDQDFLDKTVSSVYELSDGFLCRYKGNYSSYLAQREEKIKYLNKSSKIQQQQIHHAQQFIDRFRYKATKAKQVKSREKQLEKVETIAVPSRQKILSFHFPSPPSCANDVVVVHSLEKHYGQLSLFHNLDFVVNRGDRLALTGRNGTGKSSLLRILSGNDRDYEGEVHWGSGVSIGYFAQDAELTLTASHTVFEEAASAASSGDSTHLRSLLAAFLFFDHDLDKQVSVLSGGEKSRLALLKILLSPANLLILDEPTNHLDITSQHMLLAALKAYTGTLVFVSHDLYFIKQCANRILYLSEEEPALYEGDYEYFSWKLREKEKVESFFPTKKEQTQKETPVAADARKETNRMKNRVQILKRQSEELLASIAALEKDIEANHQQMAAEENYLDSERITRLVAEKRSLDQAYQQMEEQWFALHREIETLEASLALRSS